MDHTNRPLILSYGMGVDSSAILVRWLRDPSTCPVPLDQLIVLTAQTGNEFQGTGRLVEGYILPMLRQAGVRFVEIARAGKSESDGYAVLQDTREPTELHLAGRYSLADELTAAGTIPASGGAHLCSIKSKAVPLDKWIADNFDEPHLHAMGFNAAELGRVSKDVQARGVKGDLVAGYSIAFGFNAAELGRVQRGLEARAKKGQAEPIFPLVEWGWDYAACEDYLREAFGVDWLKSCCTFCPFAGGRRPILDRYQQEPSEAVRGLILETVALALNPRMALFKTKSLREVVTADGNVEAVAIADAEMDRLEWAVYHVRRVYTGKGKAQRSVQIPHRGTRDEMITALHALGQAELGPDGVLRVWVRVKPEGDTEAGMVEELYSLAPATAAEKEMGTFQARWDDAIAKIEAQAA